MFTNFYDRLTYTHMDEQPENRMPATQQYTETQAAPDDSGGYTGQIRMLAKQVWCKLRYI